MERVIKEKISADHLLYVSLKYTKTCDVIINLIHRWKIMIEYSMDILVEKAKKQKKWKPVPDAPRAKLIQLKKIYAEDELIFKVLDLYELFRDLEQLEKVREHEFRKGVNLRVVYKGEAINIDLDKLAEYAALLERFISVLKEFCSSEQRRTNKMSRVITISSGKGGVGKTTTAVNLSIAIQQFGKEVILLDANLTTPNVGLHLGAPIVPVSLNHVLQGKSDVEDAIYEHQSGAKIVPSSLSAREMRVVPHAQLKEVAKRLKKMADIIIFDSAAGLGEEAVASMESADEIILVTNPDILAVTDALKASKVVESLGKEVRGIIVTRTRRVKNEMPLENIQDMLELPILGVVPEDDLVSQSVIMKDAVVRTHPKSKAARAYRIIAAKIIGKTDHVEEYSVWEKLFG